MILEIRKFANQMQTEIDNNSNKGDWRDWKNVQDMFMDLEYHKFKLLVAMKENSSKLVKEHCADCANILMFISEQYD